MLISSLKSSWILDVCKRWANSGFACICEEKYGSIHKTTWAIRSLLVLASCIEIYYFLADAKYTILFFYFFLFVFSSCMATCLIHIPHLFSPFLRRPFLIPCHFLLYRQSYPPWECDRSHSLLCCIAFARGHRETAENLCRYSRPFNRVCPQSNSLWKMTSRSAFRCAGRGPAVTHPSTDPAKSCLTWVRYHIY